MTVAKYRSGQEFAEIYAKARFKTQCQNLAAQPSDLAPSVKINLPEQVAPVKSAEGQATYRCDANQGAKIAYAYSKTALYQGFWQVSSLASFAAPADGVAVARNILMRSSGSIGIKPAWMQYQQKMDQEALEYQRARQQQRLTALSQQVQQFEAEMRSMQNQVNAFERQQASRQSQFQGFDNAIAGVTPTTDPLLGTKRDVFTGAKSGYWINGQGQIVNADMSPGPGWRQLQNR